MVKLCFESCSIRWDLGGTVNKKATLTSEVYSPNAIASLSPLFLLGMSRLHCWTYDYSHCFFLSYALESVSWWRLSRYWIRLEMKDPICEFVTFLWYFTMKNLDHLTNYYVLIFLAFKPIH